MRRMICSVLAALFLVLITPARLGSVHQHENENGVAWSEAWKVCGISIIGWQAVAYREAHRRPVVLRIVGYPGKLRLITLYLQVFAASGMVAAGYHTR